MATILSELHTGWLKARGLNVDEIQSMGIFTDRQGVGDVLVIPYKVDGQTVNHKYRKPNKKFLMDKGCPKPFYNQDCIKAGPEMLIITEGEPDCWAAIQSGFKATVSVPNGGDSNLDFMKDVEGLGEIPKIILAADNDAAGYKCRDELASKLGRPRCFFVDYPEGCKDLNDILMAFGEDGVREAIETARPLKIKGFYEIDELPPEPDLETYSTDWDNLDDHLNLFTPSFMAVTGVPGSGKSKWTLHLAAALARKYGHRVAIATFEMMLGEVTNELVDYYQGETNCSRSEALAWIKEHFGFIADTELDVEHPSDID